VDATQFGGIFRAVFAAVGGYFVGKGLVDQGTVEAVGGALVVLVTAVWSVFNKRKAAAAAGA